MKNNILSLLLIVLFPFSLFATNGIFTIGTGIKSKALGGAAQATYDHAFGSANNPASLAFSKDQLDLNLEIFMPARGAERVGGLAGTSESEAGIFPIPEFGYRSKISKKMAWGISFYGNGGANVDYKGTDIIPAGCPTAAPGNILCGTTELSGDLKQMILAPALSYKISKRHAFGVSLLLGYQLLEVTGLQAFLSPLATEDVTAVTDNGVDSAFGYGLKLGWFGRFSKKFFMGASFSTSVFMSNFENYKGLLAEQGKLDIPGNFSLGMQYKISKRMKVMMDVVQIFNSQSKALSNKAPIPQSTRLGADDGPGFGFSDQTVFKIGTSYRFTKGFTMMGGVNYGASPIGEDGVTFGILAPAVSEIHVTLGGSHKWGSRKKKTKRELNYYLMYSPDNSVEGPSSFGGTDTINMSQLAVAAGYSWYL